jgi:hypothetical protein
VRLLYKGFSISLGRGAVHACSSSAARLTLVPLSKTLDHWLFADSVMGLSPSLSTRRPPIPTTAAALAWPIREYDLFIPRLAVYILFLNISVLCTVCAHTLKYRYEMHIVFVMFTVYLWISLIKKSNISNSFHSRRLR